MEQFESFCEVISTNVESQILSWHGRNDISSIQAMKLVHNRYMLGGFIISADVFHPFYRNCIVVSDVVKVVEWMVNHWEEYPSFVLNVAGNELVSRVRIADEINRICDGKLKYTISVPNEEFYENRPKITQMESLYLYDMNILERESFTNKIQREMER